MHAHVLTHSRACMHARTRTHTLTHTHTHAQVTERFVATVVPADEEKKKKKPVTKYKTKYITKYKTLYKEKTVYVPVYDDPFWNPAVDGRSAHAHA